MYTHGDYQEVLTQTSKLLLEFPNSVILHNLNGAANKGLGKLVNAIEAYEKALSINPGYGDAYFNMGNTLKELGKLDDAVEAYKKALSIKPDYAEAYNN